MKSAKEIMGIDGLEKLRAQIHNLFAPAIERDRLARLRESSMPGLVEEEFQRESEARVIKRLIQVGCPTDVAEIVFSPAIKRTPAIEGLDSWLAAKKTSLFLTGGTGGGKTFAAVYWLASLFVDALYSKCRFLRVGQLTGMAATNDGLGELLAFCGGVPVLVIDDLGAEKLTESAKVELEKLFCFRMEDSKKRTIVTTNMTTAELATRYGDRFKDRLKQAYAVPCGNVSLRSVIPNKDPTDSGLSLRGSFRKVTRKCSYCDEYSWNKQGPHHEEHCEVILELRMSGPGAMKVYQQKLNAEIDRRNGVRR